jgi:hypothetical protein
MKLPDNFQIREHSWPCRCHIILTTYYNLRAFPGKNTQQANKMTFITSGFQWFFYRTYERGYKTSGSPLRFMLRRSSLVECVNVFHGTGVYKASIFFYS